MRLRNAPLVQVIAQVVFSPVLTMERQVPALQERLSTRFPRYRKAGVAAVPIFGGETGKTTYQWEFADRTQRTGVVVTTSSVVLHTTALRNTSSAPHAMVSACASGKCFGLTR